MAKRRSKRKKSSGFLRFCTKLLKSIIQFFIPKQISSKMGWLWFGSSRTGAGLGGAILSVMMLFSVIPVPFSAYMAEQKIGHLVQGKSYLIQYDWVNLNNISWQMQMAVIASEDQRFESHFGIDIQAIEIAFERNLNSKTVRGASTISQQTVKNMFLWPGTSWIRKGIELPLTFMLEKTWGKRRILEVYLNIAEFGNGIFGVEAAAKHFFKKSAKNLTLQEAALLASSLPNPLIFRVDKPDSTMRKRQTWIIRQVSALGGRSYLEKL